MRSTIVVQLAVICCAISSAVAGSPWDAKYTVMAQAILAAMNDSNKFDMVHGWLGNYIGDVPPIVLSDGTIIPALNLHDGPNGVGNLNVDVTNWPSALTVAMSWDPLQMEAFGAAMGLEQYKKGTNVMLGPAVNLARVPWGGRNWEYMGEDPVLASVLVAAEVRGIQSQNVSGNIKHFAFNSEETDRSGMSANVPDRAARELYLKAFSAAVDAGVGSAMCAYNRVNGTWACENAALFSTLKGTFGFRGWIMSDWFAQHSTVAAALAGLDQEMPDNSFFGPTLVEAVANGSVPMSRVDDMILRMVRRVVRAYRGFVCFCLSVLKGAL